MAHNESLVFSISIGRTTKIISMMLILLLFVTTATLAQPVFLKRITSGTKNFTTWNGKLYYSLTDSLFTSDGTPAGSLLVKKTGETILRISMVGLGTDAFFITQTGGKESLWKTDGTFSNAIKLATHNSIEPLISYQNELYLRINDGIHGTELWKVSAAGSVTMLKDIYPGSGDGFKGDLIISSNLLYFRANAGTTGTDLWKSDGTSGGTVMAVNLDDGYLYALRDFYGLTDVNGTIFMTRTYLDLSNFFFSAELWKTNGSLPGTLMVEKFEGSMISELSHFTEFNGKLYFVWGHGIPDHDLMMSDGTESGTMFMKKITRDGHVSELVKTNNHFAYFSTGQGFPGALEKSDGTIAGTYGFRYLSWYYLGGLTVNLTATPNLLFFVDDIHIPNIGVPPDGELQLFQANLSTGQTVPVKDLYSNISLEGSDNVRAAGNSIFFTTRQNQILELWYYDPTPPQTCAGAGNILREVWLGVQGNSVSEIPLTTTPSRREKLVSLETPTNYGDHYGSRMRGYLCVPQSGNYRFWISSNDNSELWLSSSSNPANKVKIAHVNGFTNVRQYDKYPSQESGLINLVAGQLYYIEALHKEGVGTDHVSVGWQLPNGAMERPIPGVRLIPYHIDNGNNQSPQVSFVSPQNFQTFNAPATVSIQVNATDSDGTITKVEFYRNGIKIGHDLTAPYTFTWTNASAGNYTLVTDAFDNDGAVSSDTVNITISNTSTARTSEMHGAEEKGNVELNPNPVKHGSITLSFFDYNIPEKNNIIMIEVVSLMGKVMYSGPVFCQGKCETIQLDITDKYASGVYVINGMINRKRFSKRLIVH